MSTLQDRRDDNHHDDDHHDDNGHVLCRYCRFCILDNGPSPTQGTCDAADTSVVRDAARVELDQAECVYGEESEMSGDKKSEEKTPEVVRTCSSCKACGRSLEKEPCRSCSALDDPCTLWEPEDAAPDNPNTPPADPDGTSVDIPVGTTEATVGDLKPGEWFRLDGLKLMRTSYATAKPDELGVQILCVEEDGSASFENYSEHVTRIPSPSIPTRRVRRGRWVEFVTHCAGDSVLYNDVSRMPYCKGRLTCIELRETDNDGNPIILKFPPETFHHIAQPHLPHSGMEKR